MNDDEFLNDRDKPSDTPRTEAAKQAAWCGCLVDHVTAEFARNLERELAAARAERDEWAAKWQEMRKNYAEYRWPDLKGTVHALAAEDESDRLRAQLERAMRVVEAAKELWANSEEYEFDDGLGHGAQLEWWTNLDRAIEEWEAGR